jgi:hypothetical protein
VDQHVPCARACLHQPCSALRQAAAKVSAAAPQSTPNAERTAGEGAEVGGQIERDWIGRGPAKTSPASIAQQAPGRFTQAPCIAVASCAGPAA